MPPKKAKAPVVFESVSHPRLTSLDPADAVRFMRERELYEIEIKEREKDGNSVSPASYRVSLDPVLLRSTHARGYFDLIAPDSSVDELTEDDIKKSIEEQAKQAKADQPDSNMIEAALKGLRTNMKIVNARARIFQLALDYDQRMAEIGYEKFREDNPKKAVSLIVMALHPPALRAQIENDLEYQPALKKKWKKFLAHTAHQAECIQLGLDSVARASDHSCKTRMEKSNGSKSKTQRDGGERKSESAKKSDKDSKSDSSGHGKGGSTKRKGGGPPRCLNEDCNDFHYLRECQNTTPERKKELYQEHKEKKKNEKGSSKAVRDSADDESGGNTTMFRACFADVAERTVCADGGSDINLMPPALLEELQKRGANMMVRKFGKPRSFGLAVSETEDHKPVHVSCDREVTLDTQLLIRHGTSLILRNLTWYVASQKVPEPLLGRPLLKALGLNTRKVLEAASAAHKGTVDVEQIMDSQDDNPSGSIARVMEDQGVFHHSGSAVDAMYDQTTDDELGIDTEADIQSAFDKLASQAVENGCPYPDRLRQLLEKHRDVFRCKLGPDPPALVPPMKVSIRPGAKPIRARTRSYSKEQRRVLRKFIRRAEKFGFVRENSNASWAAAPLLVMKVKIEIRKKRYRVAFDLRPVNAVTLPMAWPMPHVDSEMSDFKGSKYYVLIDFPSGYWQLPLDPASQEFHSIITPFGVFSPTRTVQGGKNSAAKFQSRVEPCFATIRDNLKAWLDDFLLHARTPEELLDILDKFLTICAKVRLKVSATKSTLFATSVKWCGRVIDKDGSKMDPRQIEGLLNVEGPESAEELSQFIHCAQWMSQCIPDFSARIHPLRQVLERAYLRGGGKRTNKSIAKINLCDIGWGRAEEETLKSIQESLKNAVSLAHHDPEKCICVYTDASSQHWAAVVTQCDKDQLHLELEQQEHKPLAFLGGEFKDASLSWSTIEKEGFAIYSTFQKMDYLLMTSDRTYVYTDHRNLLFVFHPTALEPGLGRHVVSKLQRWALFLSQFSYHIQHVHGDRNVMADIMTRWFRGYRGKSGDGMARRVRTRSTEESATTGSWPTIEEIRAVQQAEITTRPKNARVESEIVSVNGRVWIPSTAHDMQLRIIVLSHCGVAGHRGQTATASIAREKFYWKTLGKDCNEFVRQCLHCLTSSSGEKVPRPLASTLHASRPNEVLHFDFLFMGKGSEDMKYVLLLKDDFSSYCWLEPCTAANHEVVTRVISRWIRTFTVMSTWVSDRGSHFKNQVIQRLAKTYGILHNFVIAYSPWASGTVERLCREVLRASRSVISDRRLGQQDWPEVINLVQTALNESPVKRLGVRTDGTYRTPLEVMTGIKPRRSVVNNVDLPICLRNNVENVVSQLQKELEQVHKDVLQRSENERKRARDSHNSNANILRADFSVGDFVIVRRATDRVHKLSSKWTGPRRVVMVVSNSTYVVESLTSSARDTVHASRLKLVCDEANADLQTFKEHAVHNESMYETVHSILGTEWRDDVLYGRVKWESYEEVDDVTIQPFHELCEDVPDMVQAYIRNSHDGDAEMAYGQWKDENDPIDD